MGISKIDPEKALDIAVWVITLAAITGLISGIVDLILLTGELYNL